jgi:hypothetical protein
VQRHVRITIALSLEVKYTRGVEDEVRSDAQIGENVETGQTRDQIDPLD